VAAVMVAVLAVVIAVAVAALAVVIAVAVAAVVVALAAAVMVVAVIVVVASMAGLTMLVTLAFTLAFTTVLATVTTLVVAVMAMAVGGGLILHTRSTLHTLHTLGSRPSTTICMPQSRGRRRTTTEPVARVSHRYYKLAHRLLSRCIRNVWRGSLRQVTHHYNNLYTINLERVPIESSQ
jgi:hypothetical protein